MNKPNRKLRVGVTIHIRDGNQSIWENGIFQNCVFLVQLFNLSPGVEKAVLVNGGGVKGVHPSMMFDQVGVEMIDLPNALESLDVVIEMSSQVPDDWLEKFRAKGGRIAWMRCGNDFVIDIERAMNNLPHAGLCSSKVYDAIWTLPEYKHSCTDYFATTTRAPVKIVPHLWTPEFFDKSTATLAEGFRFSYEPGKPRWRVCSFEPNVCMVKTCINPMLVCEEAYRNRPQMFEAMRICNTLKAKENAAFVRFARFLDIVNHGVATFEGRFAVYEYMAHHGDCIVSHHWENGQNYLYYEALHGGYPLIHNSEFIRELGYFYPEFDAQLGGEALLRAFETHDRNLADYKTKSAEFLKTLDIRHQSNIQAYTAELLALFDSEKIGGSPKAQKKRTSPARIKPETGQGGENSAFPADKARGIDQIHLINLDRRPDRLERFLQSHPDLEARLQRFSAYDGKALELTSAITRLFAPNNFNWHKATMGCALSHLALWHRLSETDGESWLILEDDARLLPGWESVIMQALKPGALPEDWEIFFLGGILPKYRDFFEANVQPLPNGIGRVKENCVFGSNPPGYFHFCAYAYLLSQRGAKRLLELVEKGNGVWMQADFLAAYTTPDLSPPRPVYFAHPLVAESFQDSEEGFARPYGDEEDAAKMDSDIWKEKDCFTMEGFDSRLDLASHLDIHAACGLMPNEVGCPKPEVVESGSGGVESCKKIGLVCVTRNSVEKLKVTLDSIIRNTDASLYTLYVIDNSSTDGTKELCAKPWPDNIRFIHSETNLGWVGAINHYMPQLLEHKFIGFLNDDIEVGFRWLDHLAGILERHPEVGAVGPLTSNDRDWQGYDRFNAGPINPNLPLLGEINRNDVQAMASAMANFNPGITFNDGLLAFFCVLFRSEVIRIIGPLDAAFNDLYLGDDDDYCKRILAAGYVFALSFNAYVAHHSGSRSLMLGDYSERYKKAQEIIALKTTQGAYQTRGIDIKKSLGKPSPSQPIPGIDKIWVINLERRRDRLGKFLNNNPDIAKEVSILKAYDGKKLQLTPKIARLFAPNEFHWNKATMGCSLSHLELWHKLVNEPGEKATYLIFEDDTKLTAGWRDIAEHAFTSGELPQDWDIIYLGGILPKNKQFFTQCKERIAGSISRIVPNEWFGQKPPNRYFHFCANAYLLSKRGANKLLEFIRLKNGIWPQADMLLAYVTPTGYPVQLQHYFFDPLLADCFQDIEDEYLKPYSENHSDGLVDSDIWNENDCLDKQEAEAQCNISEPFDIIGALRDASLQVSIDNEFWSAGSLSVFNHKELVAKLQKAPAESSAIVLCADSGFFAYTSVVILSLIKNGCCGEIPIYLFAEEFSKDDIEKFRQLVEECPCRLTLVKLGEHDLKNLPAVRHMSRATYLRLFLPELLKEFEKILYLDSDVLVLSDLRELLDTNLGDSPVAAVRDLIGERNCKIDFFRSGEKHYFNAGVLLINPKQWIEKRVGERVLGLAVNDSERKRLSAFADQCLINFVVRGDFVELDNIFNWFAFEPRHCSPEFLQHAPTPKGEDLRKAKILHFTGHCKPWHKESSLNEIWNLYDQIATASPWSESIQEKKSPRSIVQRRQTPMHAIPPMKNLPDRRWDYVSPNFVSAYPDEGFPYMIIGDVNGCPWPYLRRHIPHNWYSDRRNPYIGFASRDEAGILFNTALDFANRQCLEIGCWMGWSAAHLLLGGVKLDIVDPIFSNPDHAKSVRHSLSWSAKWAPACAHAVPHAGTSPEKVRKIAVSQSKKWSLAFIDGDHEGLGPVKDAEECEKHLEENALVLFHDLSSPFVAKGLDFFRDRGWKTKIYNTMQIMGVAWRGNVIPVEHQPDPMVEWDIPKHLLGYEISNFHFSPHDAEFERLYKFIRPYTMVGRERLKSLFDNAVRICRENVPGDFVECGTCRGGSAALLAHVVKKYSKIPRTVYACDTFEGMPEPGPADSHRGIPASDCGFPAGSLKAPLETGLLEISRKLGVEMIIQPVKGFFRETLPGLSSRIPQVAFLHADGDWYESTMDIFNSLYGNVVTGGFIQIDDYGHWEGCRQAVEDFQKSQFIRFPLSKIDDTGYSLTKQVA